MNINTIHISTEYTFKYIYSFRNIWLHYSNAPSGTHTADSHLWGLFLNQTKNRLQKSVRWKAICGNPKHRFNTGLEWSYFGHKQKSLIDHLDGFKINFSNRSAATEVSAVLLYSLRQPCSLTSSNRCVTKHVSAPFAYVYLTWSPTHVLWRTVDKHTSRVLDTPYILA